MAGVRRVQADRIRAERKARAWDKPEMARRLAHAAGDARRVLPDHETLLGYVKRWERAAVGISERYRMLYARAFGMTEEELFTPETPVRPSGGRVRVPVDAISPPGMNGQPIDVGVVESIRATNQALVELDSLWGSHDVFPLALRVFRMAHHKIGSGAYEAAVERDLLAATGETGEIAAWLAYDADQQAASRHIIHEALMLSRQAGDRDMELFELAHLAMQSLRLRRPAEALRIATSTIEIGNLTPRVAALFEIRRGRALAQLGDERRAFAALDKSGIALSGSINKRDPHWTWWVNDTELTRHRASARAQLGQWDRAVTLHEQVIADYRSGYLYGKLDLAELLNALVHVQDWPRAEEIIIEIANLADSIGPGRTMNLLKKVFAQIGQTDKATSMVVDAAVELQRFFDAGISSEADTGLYSSPPAGSAHSGEARPLR